MSLITTSTTVRNLKLTLDKIVTDKNDGLEAALILKEYFDRETMDENYVDDAEVGGPGLATEKSEAQELDVGSLNDGYISRYTARKFGLKMIVSEEALEDGRYPKYIDAARRLKRALYKTMDIDAANVLNRATSASYVGGDGVALASASHTLPGGGTFSNTLSTPMSPSRAALIVISQNLMQTPGHDGVTEPLKPTKIVCPVAQWGAWEGIVGSEKVPESPNNEINVVRSKLKLEVVPVPYWTASTTNWLVKTDAENGLVWKDRRKARSRSWTDNDVEALKYAISARWARGWSNPRGVYYSNA
jgi:hypothetical protein